jgi:hypothetical protein
MDFYFSKGVVRYKDDGWVIIECPYGIVNYYKAYVEKRIGKKLSTSYHKPHITVLPAKHNGDFTKHPLWKKYEGKEVEFRYFTQVHTDNKWFILGQYFWLRVDCPIVAEIRSGFGLSPDLKWPAHLTIGYRGY